ncbi:RNA-directed DNA polymerase, eukaryota [Tanacetum coccineum]
MSSSSSSSDENNIITVPDEEFESKNELINIHKSQILGVGVPLSRVEDMASSLGCTIMENKFRYLGVMVGAGMTRHKAWDDVVLKLQSRLSKWKAKTLSIGGRLTLLKSVLGASPLYNMSIFKVPKGVLKVMESIRSNFFKGASMLEKKISWIAWDKVLASKKKGGLGVSSYFALNRALLLKWVWRFVSQDDSLWFRVIQAVHGDKIDSHSVRKVSIWSSILKEVQVLKSSGFDFLSYCSKRIGDGQSTSFWKETWIGDIPLCELCPRLFALDSAPNICVAAKMAGPLDTSFRRSVRGGVEQQEFSDLSSFLNSVVLSTSNDRWYFSLSSSGEFSVKDTRLAIDDLVLPSHSEPTRWVKLIPIKINVFMWRARRGCLPTRYNLVQKGVILESTSCPVCFSDEEDVHHLLFRCSLSQEVLHRVCRWWEIDFQLWRSFSEWDEWFSSIRLPGSVKGFLEGVFYVAWWFIWGFRNRSTFDVNKPSRSILFENIVSSSFLWCNSSSLLVYKILPFKKKKIGSNGTGENGGGDGDGSGGSDHRRGVLLDSHLCPLCNAAMEDVQHVFFRCDVARVVLRKICRWWDLDWQEICSFSDWDAWFLSFRLSPRLKSILEGVFYVACSGFGGFEISWSLTLRLRIVRRFLMTLFLGPFYGVLVDVIGLFLGSIG